MFDVWFHLLLLRNVLGVIEIIRDNFLVKKIAKYERLKNINLLIVVAWVMTVYIDVFIIVLGVKSDINP